MNRIRVATVSTSAADDASFRALSDVAGLTAQFEDSRVIGGHMVGLLLAAFPSPEAIIRRTVDADTAISVEIAQSGQLHELLLGAGYAAPNSSNRYQKPPGLVIDVLTPALATVFEPAEHGGRQFDSAPGLRFALAQQPIHIDVEVTMLDGTTMRFEVRVPSMESALILKAFAFSSRYAAKDVADIYNLLCSIETHGADTDISFGTRPLKGNRLDASRILHELADRARLSQGVTASGIPAVRLTALIRAHVPRTDRGPDSRN